MFVLTWVYCGKVTQVLSHADVKIIQSKRKELKKQPQYKKGLLQVRTAEGLKHKPIL